MVAAHLELPSQCSLGWGLQEPLGHPELWCILLALGAISIAAFKSRANKAWIQDFSSGSARMGRAHRKWDMGGHDGHHYSCRYYCSSERCDSFEPRSPQL